MKVSELNDEERLALMGLLKLTVSADEQLSDGEAAVLRRVAGEMGRETFVSARQQAQATLTTLDAIKGAIAAVERPAARELLYAIATEAAEPDSITEAEAKVLRWAAEAWGLEEPWRLGPDG